ncbi:ATL2 [Cordylochernes scorpioides]|uniref:ATL2 n=1 Tax=Cordylochernes scorpioides TaxID=51811 RepID=A0ABY6KD57_9ARAC|nr:ATL2 [Cordylochernes scorpioides]
MSSSFSVEHIEEMGDQGTTIQMVKFGDAGLELNEKHLQHLLCSEAVRDRPVALISVAGAFRKGKSFILNFVLRYLMAKGQKDWLGQQDLPLTGFSWRGGAERDTTGILIWSEIFLVRCKKGENEDDEEIAVILMDTQGSFDSGSTVKECATIFALSTMLSSIQVYNLFHNLQEDDLQTTLQLFTEYGRLAKEDSTEIPFQKLIFLIRDWPFPYENEFGYQGGLHLLSKRLQVEDSQPSDLQDLRKHIQSCFKELSCFLMPHPGLLVASSPFFQGQINSMEPDFVTYLKIFVESLVSSSSLVVKEIGGQRITCKELLDYVKIYAKVYNGDVLPEPKTILQATAEANHLTAFNKAKNMYLSAMERVCGGCKPYIASNQLETVHVQLKERAVDHFNHICKMGGEAFSTTYREKLEAYEKFQVHNENKNIMAVACSPIVLTILAFVFYLLSGILAVLRLGALARLCNQLTLVSTLTLILWLYIRARGEMEEIGLQIDAATHILYLHVFKPIYMRFLERSLDHFSRSKLWLRLPLIFLFLYNIYRPFSHPHEPNRTSSQVFKMSSSFSIEHIEEMGDQGTTIQMVKFGDAGLELNEKHLQHLLCSEAVRDRPVALISVAGAFRKGKSFILNFVLRYLMAKGQKDWLGQQDLPLTGFSWRGGAERDTTGILIWSEIFLVRCKKGENEDDEEIAVILMDTQGSFDSGSTVKECATIFALSTMLSSIQVYNLFHNLQEDDLQTLQLFTEYGRLAKEDSTEIPFQKLIFLIRDWPFPYENEFGYQGGLHLLSKRLQVEDSQPSDLQDLRKHIQSCFKELSCFLMPHPGLLVASSPFFQGQINSMEPDFVTYLKIFVESLVSSSSLVVKEIGGQRITCKELLDYVKIYAKVYNGDVLPEPKTILQATAEANHLTAFNKAKNMYLSAMERVCGGCKPYIASNQLETVHVQLKERAVDHFNHICKMGGEAFSTTYREKLVTEIQEAYEKFQVHNENKNIMAVACSPIVLTILAFVFYLLSGILAVLRLGALARLCNQLTLVSTLTLILWLYIRARGEMEEIGLQIDAATHILYLHVFKPIYMRFLERSLDHFSPE